MFVPGETEASPIALLLQLFGLLFEMFGLVLGTVCPLVSQLVRDFSTLAEEPWGLAQLEVDNDLQIRVLRRLRANQTVEGRSNLNRCGTTNSQECGAGDPLVVTPAVQVSPFVIVITPESLGL